MTEEEFRKKYPHSTDEQVRLYCEAVLADGLTARPAPEPDIPMPIITVPEPPLTQFTASQPSRPLTTYTAPRGSRFVTRNFSLNDAPPEVQPVAIRDDLREILLGTYGLKSGLTPEQRQRLQTTDMSEADMLAMLVGAPNAQEFAALN